MSGTTDIYDTRKIVIAPLVVLAGFALGFFAIFKKTETKCQFHEILEAHQRVLQKRCFYTSS